MTVTCEDCGKKISIADMRVCSNPICKEGSCVSCVNAAGECSKCQ